ncbi:MAG: flagellar hook-associated protein FlgK [Deltaproteobacteria bacterium HGW-Deltaproteobacteria-7]|jgi:flagellar hook-associated protein 1 FlgK|nr:MAG: flagellar hook-associated protein FlgK [Deltaproteobacteria bacterium HGW-Deltaproteobacteria-7]PKN20763.1 MAG: flagellar hook-associated protein FlgK [Deltaproteobacteria bacterium HGW-Deltaproteobacteria-6]
MADISRVLYTAKEALLSNLTAINVTGANIANVNTPGYSRLRPMFESVGTKDASSAQEQIGVRIADVERIYDRFLESQIIAQQSSVENYTAQQDSLSSIEGILNENNGGGINDALSEFLNAWGNLSVEPSSISKRDTVVSTGQNLAYIFNQRAEDIENVQIAANDSIADTVSILNSDLQLIAEYNKSIVSAESAGTSASSIRDKRAELLKKISGMIDINYMEKSDGSLYISLPTNGKALVEGFKSWELQVKRNTGNNNLYDIVFKEDPSESINDQITGGKLAGLLEVRDNTIPSYLDQLNQTASSIINKVNEMHISGYDQDGNPGESFFISTAQAKYMQVSAQIVADTRKIAASATVNADGDNATAITAIQSDKMYASIEMGASSHTVTGQITNIGQTYKDSTTITLTRGLTSTASDWTVSNGGYSSMAILTADDRMVTLDLNNDAQADIRLNLTGTWSNGETITFKLTKSGNTTNIDGYFNAFIASVGQDVDNASQSLTSMTAILNQQTDQRDQLSGVSLDEEMMNLIKYQMAYGAAGRMTSTVNELMDILINLGR